MDLITLIVLVRAARARVSNSMAKFAPSDVGGYAPAVEVRLIGRNQAPGMQTRPSAENV